jgi:hypothetical protein
VLLQQALADRNTAAGLLASLAGRRKGPKAGRPRFRSRKDRRQAIRFTASAWFKVLTRGGSCGCPRRLTCRCAGRARCRPSRHGSR